MHVCCTLLYTGQQNKVYTDNTYLLLVHTATKLKNNQHNKTASQNSVFFYLLKKAEFKNLPATC